MSRGYRGGRGSAVSWLGEITSSSGCTRQVAKLAGAVFGSMAPLEPDCVDRFYAAPTRGVNEFGKRVSYFANRVVNAILANWSG